MGRGRSKAGATKTAINAADISFSENLLRVYNEALTLKRDNRYYGRETANGLQMAISYVQSLGVKRLTEDQLHTANRLSEYRGTETDYRKLKR